MKPLAKKRRVTTPDELDASSQASAAASDVLEVAAAEANDDGPLAPFVTASAGEAYLAGHARKVVTSSAKISDRVEAFTRASFLAALEGEDRAPGALPESAYDSRFRLWKLELDEGFSVVLHGFGSKRAVLERFGRVLRRHGHVVVIDGFEASLVLADILTGIECSVLAGVAAPTTATSFTSKEGDRIDQRIRAICAHFAEGAKDPMYLIVHNIDGVALQAVRPKSALATLAAQPHIHLIASIDHFRAPLLFSSSLALSRPPMSHADGETNGNGRRTAEGSDDEDEDNAGAKHVGYTQLARGFTFVHHHAPTDQPYTHEALVAGIPSALFPPSVFPPLSALHSGRSTTAARIESALAVLAASNNRQRRTFRALAGRSPTRFSSLLVLCRNEGAVRFAHQLDTHLAEFVDHHLVQEGEAPPDVLPGEDEDYAVDEAQDNDALHATEPGIKPGWVWLTLSKAEIATVLERMPDEA